LKLYKQLAKLRQNSAFTYNSLTFVDVKNEGGNPEKILSYIRGQGGQKYLVVLNFGHAYANNVDLSKSVGRTRGKAVVNAKSSYQTEKDIDLTKITLSRGQGLVIKIQ
jgi:hypothetical protein